MTSTLKVSAALTHGMLAAQHPPDEPEADIISLTTGSAAEFYIEPRLPCVGDVDIMYHFSTELSIPAGHPPPTQLPADFHSYVRLFELINTKLPGYVYLRLSFRLLACTNNEKYTAFQEANTSYKTHDLVNSSQFEVHGPALTQTLEYDMVALGQQISGGAFSMDAVRCVRCLVWPPQAADWPTRHRKYGWPDSATVDRVVSNGVDVVGVAHPQCKQHECLAIYQWRLSFSRAEVILLNSWMLVQQIVYHMLRIFVKTERITDSADDSGTKILSNYHIKTLMLWACELKPRDWWTERSNLVRTVTKLLHTLAVWLNDARCQHYFIGNCNLLCDFGRCFAVAKRLRTLTESWLSKWFERNYVKRAAESVSLLDVHINIKTAEERRELQSQSRAMFDRCNFIVHAIAGVIHTYSLTARSALQWLRELDQLNLGESVNYFLTGVALLHFLRHMRMLRVSSVEELSLCHMDRCDVLSTVFLYRPNDATAEHICRKDNNSHQLVNIAARFMKRNASNPEWTVTKRIYIYLARAYLNAATARNPDNCWLSNLAHVYLAVLYYDTGQYRIAIERCTMVTIPLDYTKYSPYVVKGEILPKIDDNVNNSLGLVAFYQYVRSTALNHQRVSHTYVFTVELFVQYLLIRPLSVAKGTMFNRQITAEVYRRFEEYVYHVKMLSSADLLLAKCLLRPSLEEALGLFDRRKEHSRFRYESAYIPSLETLLLESAVEHLTTFRQLEARDFGSVATIVTTDFEALYAYKCGDYHRCFKLCVLNIASLLNADKQCDVYVYPEFVQLMDDGIVSLVGLMLIANPAYRAFSTKGDPYVTCSVTQRTLLMYLIVQCCCKLHPFVECLPVYSVVMSHMEKYLCRESDGIQILDDLTLKLTSRILAIYLRCV